MRKLFNILLATSSLLLITGCNLAKKTDTQVITDDLNNQAVVFEDQKVDKLIIKNMNVAFEDEISHVSFDVVNENNEIVSYDELTINFYDKEGILIYSTYEPIGSIDPQDILSLYLNSDINLTSATDIKYEIQ
ncbi:MAG: hypothetical protein PHN42_02865 [Bacilli bacterium]|nr:hypothetical protein [Bacilli bacterium]